MIRLEPILLSGALHSHCGRASVRMNRCQRKVTVDERHLVRIALAQLSKVSSGRGAERALKVGELHDNDGRIRWTETVTCRRQFSPLLHLPGLGNRRLLGKEFPADDSNRYQHGADHQDCGHQVV